MAKMASEPVEGPWALLDGWRWELLGNVANVIAGQSPLSSNVNKQSDGLPFFQGKAEFGAEQPVARNWCQAPSKVAEAGDILISVRAPVGPTNYASERCGIGRGLAAIRPHHLSARYVRYWLVATGQMLREKATGTTFEAITGDVLRNHPVPVPSDGVGDVIAARIDELFAEIDDGEAALARARDDLGTWRKALLKAAVIGDLTADWRAARSAKDGPPPETGTALLARILTERRARWEAEPKNRGKRYKEPLSPNMDCLPSIPEEWMWASFDQLVDQLSNGISAKPAHLPPGIPILRISSVRPGVVRDDHRRWLPKNFDVGGALATRGDLLFTRYNGNPELVGVCGRFRGETPIAYPDKVMCASLSSANDAVGDFLELAMNTGASRRHIAKYTKTSAGQHGVAGSSVKIAPVPMPPQAELEHIVQLFRDASKQAEDGWSDAVELGSISNTLRQSIVAAAFRGELV